MPGRKCTHPPARLYSWTAADGVFCVCCCACGASLLGTAPATVEEALAEHVLLGVPLVDRTVRVSQNRKRVNTKRDT